MTFEYPLMLWGLALVPLALGAYLLAQRRRGRYAARFTNLDLLANIVPRSPAWRRHLPTALYLAALAALLVSLARPQATLMVPRDEATVLLVMDVSGSMNATDVQPSRLAAAKAAAGSFLEQLPAQFRVGLISFAGSAQTIAPPTTDRVAVRRAINGLRADGGTAMGDGIVRALEARRPVDGDSDRAPAESPEDAVPAIILLLSDGANSSGRTQPLDAANRAQRVGVPVFSIALGTREGTLSMGGNRRVAVPPDEQTLRRIAETTDGRFFAAPTQEDLQTIYRNLASRIGFVEERQEVTFLFAAAAAGLLLGGGAVSLLLFHRFP